MHQLLNSQDKSRIIYKIMCFSLDGLKVNLSGLILNKTNQQIRSHATKIVQLKIQGIEIVECKK